MSVLMDFCVRKSGGLVRDASNYKFKQEKNLNSVLERKRKKFVLFKKCKNNFQYQALINFHVHLKNISVFFLLPKNLMVNGTSLTSCSTNFT